MIRHWLREVSGGRWLVSCLSWFSPYGRADLSMALGALPKGRGESTWRVCISSAFTSLTRLIHSFWYVRMCKVLRAFHRWLALLMKGNTDLLCYLEGPTFAKLALFTYFHLLQLAVVEPTEVNISASGFGFAICQVCNNI